MRRSKNVLDPADVTGDVVLRVFQHAKELPNGCWEWTGQVRTVNGHKYPITSVAGRTMNVRRVAWVAKHNVEPPAKGVTTSCGNELCVNPDHVQKEISHLPRSA